MIREIDFERKYFAPEKNRQKTEPVVHPHRERHEYFTRKAHAHRSIVDQFIRKFDISKPSNIPEASRQSAQPQTTQTTIFEFHKGLVRDPSGDQPKLISWTGDDSLISIPQQIGFINPEGTQIQMSASRALELGLIDYFDVEVKLTKEHAQEVLDRNNQSNTT